MGRLKTTNLEAGTRRCNLCGNWKSLTEFQQNSGKFLGRGYRCKECGKAYAARRYAEHPEKAKVQATRWRAEHLEKAKANDARRYAEHPEKTKAQTTRWRAKYPEKVREYKRERKRRRRARKAQVECTLTEAQVEELWSKVPHSCYWKISPKCPGRLTKKTRTIDHVIPIAKKGAHAAYNIVFACKYCNSAKGVRVLTLL